MKYLSLCSGIEAATVAWHSLGWTPLAFAEIEKFPSAVLAHHYPHVPNLGDITQHHTWENLQDVDLLVGGTPCQAFSVAGLRHSLADQRGNLTLTYVKILDQIDHERAKHHRPPAISLWENVPGVLTTADNAFGCFLAALAGENTPLTPPGGKWKNAGYVRGPLRTIAWRVLDAQYFGLAQRRPRLFLISSARDSFHPEKILFELESLQRHSPPLRDTQETHPSAFECGPQGCRYIDPDTTLDTGAANGPVRNQLGAGVISAPLTAGMGASPYRLPHEQGALIPVITSAVTAKWAKGSGGPSGDESQNLIPYRTSGNSGAWSTGDLIDTLTTSTDPTSHILANEWSVRRLTPTECERLQGFPDGYTRIPAWNGWRNVGSDESIPDLIAAGFRIRTTASGKHRVNDPDSPRYKALGNSMPVTVMHWLGHRIQAFS